MALLTARATAQITLLALFAAPAGAATETDALLAEVRRLAQRVEQLEAAMRQPAAEHEAGSPGEKALTARLQDLEFQLLSLSQQARMIEQVEGVSAGAALTMLAQHAGSAATSDGRAENQLNYRADVSVTLPGGKVGDAEGHLFAHFRLGQGDGLARLNRTYTGTPNTTAFRLTERDDSTALLAQAWYQLDVPLGGDRESAQSHLELNFGKIDPFVFFDQNALADDESERFLNNAFVHNPLLDSGGDMGVDSYGFTPGVRLAYHNDSDSPDWWRASIGAFGAGRGAGFDNSFSRPFAIGQLEVGRQFLPERNGTLRVYGWTSGAATPYANAADSGAERHTGWGFSLDQTIAGSLGMFARYGRSTRGLVKFDRALTLGAELGGAAWGRAHDRLGFALGRLSTSRDFSADAPALDADGDGTPDFGYAAAGAERLGEVYYNWQINDHFAVAPDVQWIAAQAGNTATHDLVLFGLRAKVSY